MLLDELRRPPNNPRNPWTRLLTVPPGVLGVGGPAPGVGGGALDSESGALDVGGLPIGSEGLRSVPVFDRERPSRGFGCDAADPSEAMEARRESVPVSSTEGRGALKSGVSSPGPPSVLVGRPEDILSSTYQPCRVETLRIQTFFKTVQSNIMNTISFVPWQVPRSFEQPDTPEAPVHPLMMPHISIVLCISAHGFSNKEKFP